MITWKVAAFFISILRFAIIIFSSLFGMHIYDRLITANSQTILNFYGVITALVFLVVLTSVVLKRVRFALLRRGGFNRFYAEWWAEWCDVFLLPLLIILLWQLHSLFALTSLFMIGICLAISYLCRRWEKARIKWQATRFISIILFAMISWFVFFNLVVESKISMGTAYVAMVFLIWGCSIGFLKWLPKS